MSMELCCSTFSFHAKLPSLSRSSIPSITLSNPSHLNTTHNSLFGFLGFSSAPWQLYLLQLSSPRTPAPVLASSSSTSSAAEVKKDKLPADLDVQEFQEPNSRVRLSVNVPPAVCDDCYQSVLREIMKQAEVLPRQLSPLEIHFTSIFDIRRAFMCSY